MTPAFADATFASLSWQGWTAIAVLGGTFALSAFTRIPADMIFMGGLTVLFVSTTLDVKDALIGFSNPGMLTVGILCVVVAGLQQTGGLAWITRHVLGHPSGPRRALARLMGPVMAMSAFLNNIPVVAMFIPVVNDWARGLRISPSKLMIPLSFAAIFGGMCTLVGTSTNLVVNGMLITDLGHSGLGMFDIALVGLPCAVIGFIYVLLAAPRTLPDRRSAVDASVDPRQYTVEMLVESGSPLAGQTIESAGLRHLPGLYVTEIDRGGNVLPAVGPQCVLNAGDRLIFVGAVDSIVDLRKFRGLVPATDQVFKLNAPRAQRCLTEAVVSNTCPLVGRSIRESRFRSVYDAAVVAVSRGGDRVPGKIGDIVLRPGDTLLLEAAPSFLERQRGSRDFYLVSGVPNSEPFLHERAPLALVILFGMVLAVALGWVEMLKAAMIAAALMVATGCCSIDRARRSIEWQVLLVIAAALAIGRALEQTGAALAVAHTLLRLGGGHPWMVLAVVYASTALFTEFITNNAAAALMFPIAVAAAQDLGVSVMPFVIVIMVAASASFATPIGYQTNLMVYGSGGYRFGDFTRFGLPLTAAIGVVAVLLAPVMFPF
jgi:di/tricarboxylate transporter